MTKANVNVMNQIMSSELGRMLNNGWRIAIITVMDYDSGYTVEARSVSPYDDAPFRHEDIEYCELELTSCDDVFRHRNDLFEERYEPQYGEAVVTQKSLMEILFG